MDTAVYDSDTLVMPLWANVLDAYGVDAANPTINFGVLSFSAYQSAPVDAVGIDPGTGEVSLSANVYEPAIKATDQWDSSQLLYDETGAPITVDRDPASYAADGGLGILMTHFHNKVGDKAQVVDIVEPSTVTGVHTPEPSSFGTASSVTVTVTGGGPTPTGSVTVKEGATLIGNGTLGADGKATVPLPADLAVGAHTLDLSYSGDDNYAAGTGQATATVAKATGATVTGTHNPEPSTFGTGSTMTVHVTSPAGTPTGSVVVKEGGTTLGAGPLVSGSATVTLPASLAVGVHSLTLSYGGDSSFEASTGAATATVVKAPVKSTTTTATADPKKIQRGQSFDVTATVTASGATPTGTVQVLRGTKLLGSGTLGTDGKVTITISKKMSKKLKKGTNVLTVKYLGTADFTASEATVTVKVKKKHH